jgi:hypothetical protein
MSPVEAERASAESAPPEAAEEEEEEEEPPPPEAAEPDVLEFELDDEPQPTKAIASAATAIRRVIGVIVPMPSEFLLNDYASTRDVQVIVRSEMGCSR